MCVCTWAGVCVCLCLSVSVCVWQSATDESSAVWLSSMEIEEDASELSTSTESDGDTGQSSSLTGSAAGSRPPTATRSVTSAGSRRQLDGREGGREQTLTDVKHHHAPASNLEVKDASGMAVGAAKSSSRSSTAQTADADSLTKSVLVPVPPLKIPGITTAIMPGRKGLTARTARTRRKGNTSVPGSKTARAPIRPPFWQQCGLTKAHDHLPGILNEPDEDDSSLNDIEASIYRMLGVPGNARSNSLSVDPVPSEKHEVEEVTCGEQADGWPEENLEDGRSVKPEVSIEEDEDKRARDKALVKASAIEGFHVMNLYRAKRADDDDGGSAWSPIHPPFRFIVNAEQQMLIMIERDENYIAGRRRDRSPVEHLAHLKRGELITAFWCIKDCHKVEPIQGPLWPPVDENDQTMVGCPFTVWVPVGAATRALHLWAAGAEGHLVMQSFSRAIQIASSRLLYLGVKLGSKGFPDSGKKEAIDPSQALRLGITAKRTMVEAAENAADLPGLVTSGALELRGNDASSVWSRGYATVDDDLRLVISRTWKSSLTRRQAAEKLRRAGALTCSDLIHLMKTPAPGNTEYLPSWSFFRGRPCLLNYRIDVNGGKLLTSSTMEAMHKLSLLPIDAEVGYGPAHGHQLISRENQSLWSMVQMLWPDATVDMQHAILRKIQCAGAETVPDLCKLITEEAPVGSVLPDSTLFRGRTCMLNFNIDQNGGKLFLASTLETLYSRAVYETMVSQFKSNANARVTTTARSKEERRQHKAMLQEQAAEERRRLALQKAQESTVNEGPQIVFEVTKPIKLYKLEDKVLSVAFSHDGKLLALTRVGGTVSIVDTEEWRPLHRFDMDGHTDAVNFCCFCPPAKDSCLPQPLLAAAGADGIVTIWSLAGMLAFDRKPECIRILHHEGSNVTAVGCSPCGKLLATGDDQGCGRLYDVTAWNPLDSLACRPVHAALDLNILQKLIGHRGPLRGITRLSFSYDSCVLASASMDKSVRIWQKCLEPPHTGEWLSSYCISFPGPVRFVEFAPGGWKMMATCSGGDRVYVWDLEHVMKKGDSWQYSVLDCGDDKDEILCTSAAWSGKQWWAATGLESGDIHLWCARPTCTDFMQIGMITNKEDWVSHSLAFSPDSRFMVSTNLLRQGVQERLRLSTADEAASSPKSLGSNETPYTEIAIYDLELIVTPHEQEIDRIIGATKPLIVSNTARDDVEVQNFILEYLGQQEFVWLEELVTYVQDKMGASGMENFFEPRSKAQSVHEIVTERAQRTIGVLAKSRSTGDEIPGQREADSFFRRDEAIQAIAARESAAASMGMKLLRRMKTPGTPAQSQTNKMLLKIEQDVVKKKEERLYRCMSIVVQWLLLFPKLFDVTWNGYVFNTNALTVHNSILVTSCGRLVTKGQGKKRPGQEDPGQSPLIWLLPSLTSGMGGEAEFCIEKWTAAVPEDGLKIGILQRGSHRQHSGPGSAKDLTWFYGAGTGMRFRSDGSTTAADGYTKHQAKAGDKLGVMVNRARGTVSIKINGQGQGVMFDQIPQEGPLFFAVQLVTINEAVRIPDAFVSSGWQRRPRCVEIDALEFKIADHT